MLLFFRRLLLLLLLLHTAAAWAQTTPAPRCFLRQFGAAEGLPQPFIYALTQDRAGYLWIGTAEGLVRYDGVEFVTFTRQDGLAEDFVTALYVEPRTGRLWAGHYQGGVSCWTGQQFRPVADRTKLPVAFRPKPGLPTAPDNFVVASLGRKLPTISLYTPALPKLLPAGTSIQCLFTDREQNLWIGTAGQGLWRWSDRHVAFYPLSSPTLSALRSRGQAIGGTTTGQLLTLTSDADRTSPLIIYPKYVLPYAPSVLLQTPNRRLQAILKKPQTPTLVTTWAGTDGHGLWLVSNSSATSPPLIRRERRLPATLSITALAQHRNGDLWVGTALDGVYRLPADSTQPAEHFTTANGLLHNTIYALTADLAGRVWIGTHDTGLAMWQQGRFRYFRFRSGGLDVSSLLTDDAGRVWIGTEGNGVLCYDKGRFRAYGPTDGLLSPYCYALLPVRWGSNFHGGYSYDRRREQVLVVHRNGLSVADTTGRFAPAALPNNPLVRELQPQAAVSWSAYCVWIRTRTGLLRLLTNEPELLPGTRPPTPTLLTSEVDGAAHRPYHLGELSATQHRVSFAFRGVSLRPGQAGLQYQYRLRGYHEQWSHPTIVGEAQFPRLDAGRYTLEVRARLGEQGAWSTPTSTSFSVATPFWRTGWFAALVVVLLVAGLYALVRVREAALRRQKLQLETTVRERTAELRRQKAHIEHINEELIVARDAAEASRRAKAQFLANMSHEIRTPMNAVIGLTHLLRQTSPTSEQNEYLQAVQSSSQNLLVIINDILDSSKIEAGKMTLEQAPLLLPELLQRVARMFQFAVESKHLYFHLHIAPDVPPAIVGDAVRLNQILVNLVGNAVKFTTQGGITLHATVVVDSAGAEHPLVRFAVTDTGIGISADKLDLIFEDFSQANTSTTRQFGGTGLGLSIARNLVQLHGGRLWVESQEGVGSTFYVELPCLLADPATVQPEATGELAPFEPALRVLVAEDNDLNQLVARKTLEAWNVHVTVAANGRLAVAAAEAHPFDAVLMDVQMPEMDGYEATRQLRLLYPDAARLPIIGLTASALPEDRALALEAGMNDTLPKPFDPAVLYTRLAQYTGRAVALAPTTTTSAPATAPPPTPHLQVDWSLLEELSGGHHAFIQQIINTFLLQAPLLAEQLTTAPDGAALAATAHKLKGQVAYFGVPTLHQHLEALEQHARRAPTPHDFSAAVADILTMLEALYVLLRASLPAAAHPHSS